MKIDLSGLDEIDEQNRDGINDVIHQILGAADLPEYEISVCLVDEQAMKELYYRFKKKKKVTDVLSFPVPDMEMTFAHTKNLLGDVVICVKQAQAQANDFGHSLREEIAVLCAHGLFHLLGYDHEISEEEASLQMQGEMYLLEKAGLSPELSLVGRA